MLPFVSPIGTERAGSAKDGHSPGFTLTIRAFVDRLDDEANRNGTVIPPPSA
jgi:hypothetical protein